jgi:hypothetical protein
MLVGHVAVGLIGKRVDPKLSLGTLLLAALLADLLWCGGSTRLGLGLWTSLPATLVVEGGFWALAIVAYVRSTSARRRSGSWAFWFVTAFLTLAWYNNIAGPPPASGTSIPISSLIFFSLVVLWGYWMNRARSGSGPKEQLRAHV